jgi:hypothetical protein
MLKPKIYLKVKYTIIIYFFLLFYYLGVYGRLGDLAKIEKKYEKAIYLTMGTKLDVIVVQDTSAAEKLTH